MQQENCTMAFETYAIILEVIHQTDASYRKSITLWQLSTARTHDKAVNNNLTYVGSAILHSCTKYTKNQQGVKL